MEGLTPRQEQVLEFIRESVRVNGYPPTVREICAALELSSPSTVHAHLANLERLGLIKRDPTKAARPGRGRRPAAAAAAAAGRPCRRRARRILIDENVEELVDVPGFLRRDDGDFVLRIHGDSMIGAGIFDADLIVVHPARRSVTGRSSSRASPEWRRRGDYQALLPRRVDHGAPRRRERQLRTDHRQCRRGGTRRPSRGGPSPAMSTMPLATVAQSTSRRRRRRVARRRPRRP